MKTKLTSIALSAFLLASAANSAYAKEYKNEKEVKEVKEVSSHKTHDSHKWIVRLRGIYVTPSTKGTATTLGGNVAASNAQVPELDFTRFFTKNVAAELILATSKHDMSLRGSPALGEPTGLGSVSILPPTLTLQYHFNPEGGFRPYAGAGLNYTFFYGAKTGDAATSVKYQDHLGYALQAGFDYMIDEKFGVNFDVKKIFLSTHVQVNNAYTANVRLDPWIIGAGMSYRF